MNAPNCHWQQNGVHVDVCKLILLAHGSIVLQCLTVFVPRAKEGPQSMQRRLHCTYLSLRSRLEMVAYIALGQTDKHTNRHRHMMERVSLPFESVCWNQRWNQRYDNLATKPRRQCLALWAALRVLWFTGHVDIPPIALKTHTYTHITYTYSHTRGVSPLTTSGQKASFPSSHCRSRRACGGLLVSL